MQIHRLSSTLIAIFVLAACLPGVQGQFQEQYVTSSSGYSTGATAADRSPLQFSQFWTTAAEISSGSPISAPQQFEVASSAPTAIYLGEQMQTVPYAQYKLDPAYTGANSLWIAGKTAWTQYAVIPLGSTVSLYTISPIGGTGSLNLVDSDGQTDSHNYMFYPNSQFTFHADAIGRYVLSFDLNGQASNQVVIDVVNPSAQSSYQEPYSSYYPWYYPLYYSKDHPSYAPSKSHDEIHKDGNIAGHADDGTPKRDGIGGDNKKGDDGKHDKAGNSTLRDDTDPGRGGDDKVTGNQGHDHASDIGDNNQGRTGSNNGIDNGVADTGPHNTDAGANRDQNPGEAGGSQGGNNKPECGQGYHLENGKCVADETNATG